MLKKEENIYIVGKYPHSKPRKASPTEFLQAQALGYIKISSSKIFSVIDIHETDDGFQIEVDRG